jgi:hypothetical protein
MIYSRSWQLISPQPNENQIIPLDSQALMQADEELLKKVEDVFHSTLSPKITEEFIVIPVPSKVKRRFSVLEYNGNTLIEPTA